MYVTQVNRKRESMKNLGYNLLWSGSQLRSHFAQKFASHNIFVYKHRYLTHLTTVI